MKTREEIEAMIKEIDNEDNCIGDLDIGWIDALNWVLNNE
jgi:hypothetical protein